MVISSVHQTRSAENMVQAMPYRISTLFAALPSRMRRASLLLSLAVTLSSAVVAADLRIKIPEGMKAVSRQEGDTLEIAFVPLGKSKKAGSEPVQIGVDANGASLPAEPTGTQ